MLAIAASMFIRQRLFCGATPQCAVWVVAVVVVAVAVASVVVGSRGGVVGVS